jgi:transcriptional regulator with XRE-family HTH domain
MKKLREIVAANVVARMGSERQKAFAARAGIAQSHVSRLRHARNGITVDVLEHVAKALNCRPFELLIDTDADKKALLDRLFGPE